MSGGFHPFHPGHLALYRSATETFPDADVYVAATADTKKRPFSFEQKKHLATLAGVDPDRFVQVKSPFAPREITDNYDPERDVVIFVRSEKDRNTPPTPGGIKKDGSPSHLQPYDPSGDLAPFGTHSYMEYLPVEQFGSGMKSASEIRAEWPELDRRSKLERVKSLYPINQKQANAVVRMFDQVLGQPAHTTSEEIASQ